MLKKILSFIAALLTISILTFLLIKLSSQNPAENYLRATKTPITKENLEATKIYLGLNLSLPEQYLTWLKKILVGDFGQSYFLKEPVLPLVLKHFQMTAKLAFAAFGIILITAIPLGILSGLYANRFFDKIIRFFTFTSVSMPQFWLAYLFMLFFGVILKWLPISGNMKATSFILPSLTLSIPLIGQYVALIRKTVLENLTSLHVENAKLRGVSTFYIIKNHLLRNALPVLITGLGLTFLYLLTGSLIVEDVFAWNGIGRLFVKSINTLDLPVIQASMLLFGILFLVMNEILRFLQKQSDPRQKIGGKL